MGFARSKWATVDVNEPGAAGFAGRRWALAGLVAGSVLCLQPTAMAQTVGAPPPAAGAPPAAAPAAAPTGAPAGDPAAAPASAAASGDALTEEQKKEEGYGLLGPVRVGPAVGLIGLLRPVDIGLYAKYKRYAALGISYSFLPISLSNVKFYAFEFAGRWFPFKGSFFLSLGMAFQTLSGEAPGNAGGTVTADISNAYVVPRLGWMWMWDSGFNIGLDLGVQIPISSSGTVAVTGGPASAAGLKDLEDSRKTMQDLADLVGKTPLPAIQLLRLGFLF